MAESRFRTVQLTLRSPVQQYYVDYLSHVPVAAGTSFQKLHYMLLWKNPYIRISAVQPANIIRRL